MERRTDGILKMIPGERFTPYALARKLGAKVILESSSFKKGKERYSILMVNEAFRIHQSGTDVILKSSDNQYRIKSTGKDILDVLLYFANQHKALHQDIPFPAGGVGFLSYEFAAFCDTVRLGKKKDMFGLPLAAFLFGHIFIVFDHYTDILYILGINYKEHEIDLEAEVERVCAQINDLNFNYLSNEDRPYAGEILGKGEDKAHFEKGVEIVKEEIIKGNLLQGVLSRRLRVKTEMSALEAYKRIRSVNPSPYLFFLDFGAYQLFGASPEVHVKVKDGNALVRPIAGTRRRGKTRAEDRALEKELLADEKERAEHLMLIDLARNDLGRICTPGTVKMTANMEIERYSHVMHIVSQVEGSLSRNRTGIDAIRATFPAGTVSGAPKIRAIETIDALEPEPRGFYAGLVGYLEPDGNLDTCITIRSALKKDGIMVLQAGAGIVYDSVPSREYEETNEKLMALTQAIGVEV